MRRVLWLTLLVGVLFHTPGCTIATVYTMVNNTGGPMVMLPMSSLEEDYKGYPVIIEYYSREENHQVIEGQSSARSMRSQMFDFSREGIEYRYTVNSSSLYFLPGKYRKRFLSANEYVVQVEPDGRIFVLKPNDDIPARVFPEQPEGFPLVPEKTVIDP